MAEYEEYEEHEDYGYGEAEEAYEYFPEGKQLRCPYCGSSNVEPYGGQYVCLDCGSVIGESPEMIDTRPERREFQPEDAQKRRYVPTPMISVQPPSLWVAGEGIQRTAPKDARSRNAAQALNILNEIIHKLNLPKQVRDYVMEYFRKLSAKRAIRRERVQAIVAALVYLASRQAGFPKPLDKIAKVSGVKKKDISKAYRMIKEELKIPVPIPDAEKFVLSFGRELQLSGETIAKAIEIVKKAKEKGISIGRDPAGIAAAALYIATKLSGEKRTQKKVAEIAGVTEVTVRNRYREIMKLLEDEDLQKTLKEDIEELEEEEEETA